MPSLNLNQYWEDEDGDAHIGRQPLRKKPRLAHPISKPAPVEQLAEDAAADVFEFSYNASRHERVWIFNALEYYHDARWISDVLRLVKGGKEASVYQCAANPDLAGAPYLAAKIYRPTLFRSLKNDHFYREGRDPLDGNGNLVTDDGVLHAIQKRTKYGRQVMHTSWLQHEVSALRELHAAGADVPQPFASGDNVILMGYIGGPDMAAPTLNSIHLAPQEARLLFDRVLHNIEIMLDHQLVHGDLSAFNILYWEGEITLIDFPQAISPYQNRNAFAVFRRDLTRVCEYFAQQGVVRSPARLAERLWNARRYPTGPEVHPKDLDEESDADRAFWERINR